MSRTGSSNRQVVRNFLALGSGEAVSRVIAFGATLYAARVFGPDAYGVVAFAVGVNLYLSKIADFGIDAAGAKEVAEASVGVRELAASVLSARLALTALLTVAAAVVFRLALPEPERTILPLFVLALLPIAANLRWVHIGLENATPVGLARVAGEALILVLILALVRSAADVWIVPVAQVAGETLVAGLLYGVLVRRGLGFRLRWDLKTALPVFKRGWPLLVQVLLGLLTYNSDLLFLRVLRDSESVGYYAAAYTLISFAANLGMAYSMSLLPTLTRVRTTGTAADEHALVHTATTQAYAATLPLAVLGCAAASFVILLGFGADYAPATIALQVLVWSIPFSTLKFIPWVALIAQGKGNRQTGPMVWSVVVIVVLNAVLIPPFGLVGAAVATVVTEVVGCALMFRAAVQEGVPLVPLRRLWRPTVAAAAMQAMLLVSGSAPLFLALGLGVLAFAASLTLLGGLRWRAGVPTLDL
jgi:PST family polysaccharide transporter